MSITKYKLKNGDVRYEVNCNFRDSFGKNRRIHKRGFETAEKAKDYEAKLRLEIKKTQSNVSLKVAISDFLDYKDSRGLKERTLYDYEMMLNGQIVGYFGDIKLKRINIGRLKDWQNYLLNKGLSKSRCKSLQSIMKQLLRYSVMMGFISSNPFDFLDFAYPRDVSKRMEYYTLEEYKLFRRYITDDIDYIIFDLLYFTGMRKGELLARRWVDLDFANASLSVHSTWDYKTNVESKTTKTGGQRMVYINSLLINELKTYREKHPFDEFILQNRKGRPIDKNILPLHRDVIIDRCNADGNNLKTIRIHDFRHSHVSFLINSGVDSFRIAERLGHSKDMVERRYGHLFPDRKKEILDVLEVDL